MNRIERHPITALAMAVALLAASGLASADTRIERSLDIEPGGTLRLDTDSGSVSVVGGSQEKVEIVLTSSRDDLEERFSLSFESSGGDAEVRAKKLGNKWFNWSRDSMHFEVRLPRASSVFIDTAGGRIELRNLEGEADLRTSGGGIEAEDIDGDVLADTSGGAIKVSDVRGSVHADTSGGSISIDSVSGEVMADTSGGRISIHDVGGDVVADTSGGGIDISGASGSVRAETSGGPVTVAFTAGNSEGGFLSSSGGRVTAVLDPSASLDIDASTSGGSVRIDLPITVRGTVSKSSLRGQLNDGGAVLKLRSSGGGIRIESN